MSDHFKNYSQYYDLFQTGKDYQAEVDYVKELISSFDSNPKTILELGCGTGKHAELLSKNGFKVLGLDLSEDMIAIAKSKTGPNLHFHQADITMFQLNEKFDATLSLFHVVSYLTETARLIQTFKNVYDHLNTDGLFIFDVWHGPAVQHLQPEERSKTIKIAPYSYRRDAKPVVFEESNKVVVNYEITIENIASGEKLQNIYEKHPMRYFSKPEIEILAAASGFKLLQTEEFLTRATPSKETWGVCYILKKQTEY